MAFSLKTLVSGMYSRLALNSNFQKIEDKVNNDLVHRQNGSAVMHQDLDMNSNKILNIEDPVEDLDVANKKYVDERGDYVLGLANQYTDQECSVTLSTAISEAKSYTDTKHLEAKDYTDTKHSEAKAYTDTKHLEAKAYIDTEVDALNTKVDTLNTKVDTLDSDVDVRINNAISDMEIELAGTDDAARYAVKALEGQTEFVLPFTNFKTVEPFINGVLQSPYAYVLNGSVVEFSEPLTLDDEVVFFVGVAYQFTDYQSVQSFNFETTEGQTVIELDFNPLAEGAMVFIQGVKQRESAYTLTASSIVFQEELQEGLEIEVLRLVKVQEDTQFLSAVSFFKQTIDNNVLIPAGYNGLSVLPVVNGSVTVSENSSWAIIGEGAPMISIDGATAEAFIEEELEEQFDDIDDEILAGVLAALNS